VDHFLSFVFYLSPLHCLSILRLLITSLQSSNCSLGTLMMLCQLIIQTLLTGFPTEKFEYTKGVFRSHKSKKEWHYNGHNIPQRHWYQHNNRNRFFIWNVTAVFNYVPESMTKKTIPIFRFFGGVFHILIAIYQMFPRISELICHPRACSNLFSDFLQCHRLLTTKLFCQCFFKNRLILSLQCVSENINNLMTSILSHAYRLNKKVLAVIFWFKISSRVSQE